MTAIPILWPLFPLSTPRSTKAPDVEARRAAAVASNLPEALPSAPDWTRPPILSRQQLDQRGFVGGIEIDQSGMAPALGSIPYHDCATRGPDVDGLLRCTAYPSHVPPFPCFFEGSSQFEGIVAA